jgi:Spy/CpxP family protein refolding chaperone
MNDTSATRKAALWVGVVFLLGAALGGTLGYVFAHRVIAAPPQQLTDAERRAQKVQRLTQELNLSPDQQKQLDTIMASVQAEYKAIHQSTEPQIDQARQKGREQIRAILTPEQKPKFEDFLRRLDEERKRNASPPVR